MLRKIKKNIGVRLLCVGRPPRQVAAMLEKQERAANGEIDEEEETPPAAAAPAAAASASPEVCISRFVLLWPKKGSPCF